MCKAYGFDLLRCIVLCCAVGGIGLPSDGIADGNSIDRGCAELLPQELLSDEFENLKQELLSSDTKKLPPIPENIQDNPIFLLAMSYHLIDDEKHLVSLGILEFASWKLRRFGDSCDVSLLEDLIAIARVQATNRMTQKAPGHGAYADLVLGLDLTQLRVSYRHFEYSRCIIMNARPSQLINIGQLTTSKALQICGGK